MIDFKKYFIIGTNSDALHDTMNGTVTGELIRCEDCKYNHGRGGVYCELLPQMFGRTEWENHCSLAEPKGTMRDH